MIAQGLPKQLRDRCDDPKVRRFLTRGAETEEGEAKNV